MLSKNINSLKKEKKMKELRQILGLIAVLVLFAGSSEAATRKEELPGTSKAHADMPGTSKAHADMPGTSGTRKALPALPPKAQFPEEYVNLKKLGFSETDIAEQAKKGKKHLESLIGVKTGEIVNERQSDIKKLEDVGYTKQGAIDIIIKGESTVDEAAKKKLLETLGEKGTPKEAIENIKGRSVADLQLMVNAAKKGKAAPETPKKGAWEKVKETFTEGFKKFGFTTKTPAEAAPPKPVAATPAPVIAGTPRQNIIMRKLSDLNKKTADLINQATKGIFGKDFTETDAPKKTWAAVKTLGTEARKSWGDMTAEGKKTVMANIEGVGRGLNTLILKSPLVGNFAAKGENLVNKLALENGKLLDNPNSATAKASRVAAMAEVLRSPMSRKVYLSTADRQIKSLENQQNTLAGSMSSKEQTTLQEALETLKKDRDGVAAVTEDTYKAALDDAKKAIAEDEKSKKETLEKLNEEVGKKEAEKETLFEARLLAISKASSPAAETDKDVIKLDEEITKVAKEIEEIGAKRASLQTAQEELDAAKRQLATPSESTLKKAQADAKKAASTFWTGVKNIELPSKEDIAKAPLIAPAMRGITRAVEGVKNSYRSGKIASFDAEIKKLEERVKETERKISEVEGKSLPETAAAYKTISDKLKKQIETLKSKKSTLEAAQKTAAETKTEVDANKAEVAADVLSKKPDETPFAGTSEVKPETKAEEDAARLGEEAFKDVLNTATPK
jgi:hypothetical protein